MPATGKIEAPVVLQDGVVGIVEVLPVVTSMSSLLATGNSKAVDISRGRVPATWAIVLLSTLKKRRYLIAKLELFSCTQR